MRKFRNYEMARVTFIQNPKHLEPFLKKLSVTAEKNCQCMILEGRTEPFKTVLAEKNIGQVTHPFSQEEREKFLKEYVDFVGTLDVLNSDRLWWATDVSSKNRFTSQLPFFLQQFWLAKEKIKKKDYDHLIVVGVSWVLADSLQKILGREGIPYTIRQDGCCREAAFILGCVRRWGSILYNVVIFSLRKIYQITVFRKSPENKKYYVIKSFLYDHSITVDGHFEDVFFGPLPSFLAKKTDILILANVLGNFRHCIQKIKHCNALPIFPLESFVSLWDIVTSFIRVLFFSVKVKKEVLFFGDSAEDIVNNELKRTFFKIHPYQYLHYQCIKNLVKKISITTFLLTHENNPWEKMCIMALRRQTPETKIIGYQHAVVPQASANMFISRLEEKICPKPDKVLTVGAKPCAIIKKYSAHQDNSIEAAGGLKYGYLFSMTLEPRKKTRRILLALEGIFDSYKVVNYAMRELKGKDQYQMTIRTHPVMPVASFRHKLDFTLDSFSNFKISKGKPLKDDLRDHDIVMYWGSTVALEAILTGKPVVHFDNGSILSYDPLFECPHFKRSVGVDDYLASALEEIYNLSDQAFEEERKKAQEYIEGYFFPITEENLQKFLHA